MQFIRYLKDGEIHSGYLDGDQVGPISGDIFGEFVRHRRRIPLAEVRLLAPCQPSKIVAIGNNFADRARALNLPLPSLPLMHFKPISSVIGPGEAIQLPPQSQKVEHGAELAIVIGKRARRVTPDEALAYVLGYTCANDVIAVDLVEQDGAWARGSGFDTFCPLGPCITTYLDPTETLITCRVNGETRQMTSTHDMVFTAPQIVAFISSVMTLLPGDLILAGTPAGAGLLAAGDVVEVEIEGIGRLSNPVAADER